MASTPIWTSCFSVGHPTLDNQHRRLLALCSRLEECLTDHSVESIGEIHGILHDLSIYTREHFAAEEDLLRNYGFPDLADHEAEHAAFQERLTGFLCEATKGIIDKVGLHQFIEHWWQEHILKADMEYKALVMARR